MHPKRSASATLRWVAAALFAFACAEPTAPRASSPDGLPQYDISDASHHSGNPHVFFLPPITSAVSSTNGAFDPDVDAAVDVCELVSSSCGRPVAHFSRTDGSGSEVVRVDAAAEQYIVDWHTNESGLVSGRTYRVRLVVKGTLLGYADVQVFANA